VWYAKTDSIKMVQHDNHHSYGKLETHNSSMKHWYEISDYRQCAKHEAQWVSLLEKTADHVQSFNEVLVSRPREHHANPPHQEAPHVRSFTTTCIYKLQ